MANSKRKGSKNEREVAKILQDWTGYEFARTPQSGGLHWKKKHTSGDIVCIDDKHGTRFSFSVECKFHEDFSILPLITGAIGKKSLKILDFWDQSNNDAISVEKVPIVFMRKNGMKKDLHFVILSQYFFNIWLKELEKTSTGGWLSKNGIISYSNPASSLHITILNSEDLMSTDYIYFHKAARKLIRQRYGKKT